MQIQPYLSFSGACSDAIAYYRETLGAEELFRMHFRDAPPDPDRPPMPPELADKVMHATLRIGESVLMMSDGGCMTKTDTFTGFSLSLTGDDAAAAQRYFDALAKDGKVMMPFQKTFWSPGFGVVTDRFGVPWMVTAPPLEQDG
ncbi:MAG TPA: VOC family metalloprotein YjdN [Paraburkholderia sp.]|jgi:PhnB protein|nr:VOC family metalloprotein YjdN [Paraburkholderia sp.]